MTLIAGYTNGLVVVICTSAHEIRSRLRQATELPTFNCIRLLRFATSLGSTVFFEDEKLEFDDDDNASVIERIYF
jgi:hypothetical protein